MHENKIATRGDLELLGFKNCPHFTVTRIMTLELSRGRYLTASDIGGNNETIFIGSRNDGDDLDDLVCIHNRYYDGQVKWDFLQDLIDLLGGAI